MGNGCWMSLTLLLVLCGLGVCDYVRGHTNEYIWCVTTLAHEEEVVCVCRQLCDCVNVVCVSDHLMN